MSFLNNFKNEQRRVAANVAASFTAPQAIEKANQDELGGNPSERIEKNMKEMYFEKGGMGVAGEVRTWGGKKYKKQSSGKWMQVSESHGLTRKEHAEKNQEYSKKISSIENEEEINKYVDRAKKHTDTAFKLDDKEYDESELSGGEPSDEEVRASIKAKKEDQSGTRVGFQETPEKVGRVDTLSGQLYKIKNQVGDKGSEFIKQVRKLINVGKLDEAERRIKNFTPSQLDDDDDEEEKGIKKSIDSDFFEKARIVAPIGTIKEMGGREYIKAANGEWKYHGKGGGTVAQQHSTTVHQTRTENPELHQQSDNEKIAAEKMGDIDHRFRAFAMFTNQVVKKKSKSMIAYGTGGVGKTYTVTRQLEAAGKKAFDDEVNVPGDEDYDYIKITGKMTAPQLYKALYEHNGKILLFDDCDSVLRDGSAINLFKGALDTSGDGTIAYGTSAGVKGEENEDGESTKIPKRFKFNGQVIFISNLPPDQVPQPLKSRALKVDLTMNKQQTIDRIRKIAEHPVTKQYTNLHFPGIDKYSHKDLSDVIDYLESNKDHIGDLNVRTVGKMLGIKQEAAEMGEKDWQSFADQELFSKGEDRNDFYDGGAMRMMKARINSLYKGTMKKNRFDESKEVTSDYTYGEDEFEKGGEGSRGGKVIGHTKSGKPIYDKATHLEHKNFTKEDHTDAAELHESLADKYEHQEQKSGSRFMEGGEAKYSKKTEEARLSKENHKVEATNHRTKQWEGKSPYPNHTWSFRDGKTGEKHDIKGAYSGDHATHQFEAKIGRKFDQYAGDRFTVTKDEVEKSETNTLEKGGKAAFLGEIRKMGESKSSSNQYGGGHYEKVDHNNKSKAQNDKHIADGDAYEKTRSR